jgi:hypothetical protein
VTLAGAGVLALVACGVLRGQGGLTAWMRPVRCRGRRPAFAGAAECLSGE